MISSFDDGALIVEADQRKRQVALLSVISKTTLVVLKLVVGLAISSVPSFPRRPHRRRSHRRRRLLMIPSAPPAFPLTGSTSSGMARSRTFRYLSRHPLLLLLLDHLRGGRRRSSCWSPGDGCWACRRHAPVGSCQHGRLPEAVRVGKETYSAAVAETVGTCGPTCTPWPASWLPWPSISGCGSVAREVNLHWGGSGGGHRGGPAHHQGGLEIYAATRHAICGRSTAARRDRSGWIVDPAAKTRRGGNVRRAGERLEGWTSRSSSFTSWRMRR